MEEEKESTQEVVEKPPRKDEMVVALLKMARQPTKNLVKKVSESSSKKPRQLDPTSLDDPGIGADGGGLDQRQSKGERDIQLG